MGIASIIRPKFVTSYRVMRVIFFSKESSEFVAKRKEHYDTYMDLGQARRLARLALDAETGEPTITNTEGFTQVSSTTTLGRQK